MLVHHRVPSMKILRALLLPLDGMLVHRGVPSMKQLGVSLLPLTVNGMLVYRRVTLSILLGFFNGHLYPFLHLVLFGRRRYGKIIVSCL